MLDCGLLVDGGDVMLWLMVSVKILFYVVNMVVLCYVVWQGVGDVIFVSMDGYVLEGFCLMVVIVIDGD